MASKLKVGDRIFVKIRSDELYEGTVEYISSQTIDLFDIICCGTNTPYDGSMTFYRNEIVKIIPIKPSETVTVRNGKSFDTSDKIKLDPNEYDRLKQMTYNFIFVDNVGKRFDDAIDVLNDRESVAVVGLGNNPLSLLLMADFKQVFIFDVRCLRHSEFMKIRKILEAPYICKVVHDGTALYDYLYHKHDRCEMTNVFDVQIVDSIIMEEEHGQKVKRNISECLMHHLNFPSSLLSAAVDDNVETTWMTRPIIKSDKIKAAQLVTYLLTLRDYLMSKILKKYTDVIDSEYTKYKLANGTNVAFKSSSKS